MQELNYEIGMPGVFWGLKRADTVMGAYHANRTRPFSALEIMLYVYDREGTLLAIVHAGAMWGRYYRLRINLYKDDVWLKFERFCAVMERYVQRLLFRAKNATPEKEVTLCLPELN